MMIAMNDRKCPFHARMTGGQWQFADCQLEACPFYVGGKRLWCSRHDDASKPAMTEWQDIAFLPVTYRGLFLVAGGNLGEPRLAYRDDRMGIMVSTSMFSKGAKPEVWMEIPEYGKKKQ